MYNREIECMSQYPYQVTKMSRVRGGIWCQCEEGDFFLKEYEGGPKRILFLKDVLTALEKRGFAVDTPVLTTEGEPIGEDTYGKQYTLRKWFVFWETAAGNYEEAQVGAFLLGQLTTALLEMENEVEVACRKGLTFVESVQKQNRELKNISNFIDRKRKKNEFDRLFRNIFSKYYEQGREVAEKEAVFATSPSVPYGLSHRDYTHHNVLRKEGKLALVHFDNLGWESTMADFALYTRKLLEKNHYDISFFESLLTAYEKARPLSEAERRQLYLRLLYPSRFLKIANHYATTRKNHIILRDLEKLERLLNQEEERGRFLAFLEKNVV